jgi:Holliday junction resolvasome RuvABC DNA-binding subunit
MNNEQLKQALIDCINKKEHNRDTEEIHEEMDELLVRTLRSLGYDEAMDVFDKQQKWYS